MIPFSYSIVFYNVNFLELSFIETKKIIFYQWIKASGLNIKGPVFFDYSKP